jgi:hypothetical protein
MRKLFRITLLGAIALFSIQATNLFFPNAYADAVPAASSVKKKSKVKKRKEKILKGHRGKHTRKLA